MSSRIAAAAVALLGAVLALSCDSDKPTGPETSGLPPVAARLTVSPGTAGGYAGRGALLRLHAAERQAMHNRDAAAWAALFTPDGVVDYVPVNAPITGRPGVQAFLQGLLDGDYVCTSERMYLSGNIMVTEHVTNSVDNSNWMGMPNTGNPVQGLSHMDVWEFDGSQVSRLTTYVDLPSILRRIGLMPVTPLPALQPSFALPEPVPSGLSRMQSEAATVALWNAHDLPAYAAGIAADAQFFIAPLEATLNRTQYIALQELYFLGFSDLYLDLVRRVPLEDGWVLTECVFRGTNDGSYFGMPTAGGTVATRAAYVTRYNTDGLMTDMRIYWDEMANLVALGLAPAP